MRSLVLFVVLLVASSLSAPPKEIKLQYNFKRGDVYDWSQTASQKISQTIAGTEQNSEVSIQALLRLRVIEIVPSGARFEVEYMKVSSKIKLPMVEMIMDSEGDSSQVLNKVTKAMIGKKFNIVMTANGVVESIENIDNLWSGMNSIKGMNENQLQQMKQSMEQTFGKNSFKGSLESALPYYPENKVKAGDTWKNKTGVGMNFPVQVENTWTLESFTDAVAMTNSHGQVSTDSIKTINLPGGIKATASLHGKQVTKSTINRVTGWPQEGNSQSETKGRMIILAGGMIPEDMVVPMDIKSESNFTITKK